MRTLHADLRADDPVRVRAICAALVGSGGCVLHGSSAWPALERLEPRQANDAAKASGNRLGLYASRNVEVALLHAVLNRPYLQATLGSYRVAYRIEGSTRHLQASAELAALLRRREPCVLTDGHVYALPMTAFAEAQGDEFVASQPVRPVATLRVAAQLGEWVFDALDS